MKKIVNLQDLLIEQGRELYNGTRQEQQALPKFQNLASNPQLNQLIDRQIIASKIEGQLLYDTLQHLNAKAQGEKDECCTAIIRELDKLASRSQDAEVRDAALINALQRLNHNKITGFGSLASYAREIGLEEEAHTIHELLIEEEEIDRELSDLAERDINKKAKTAFTQ